MGKCFDISKYSMTEMFKYPKKIEGVYSQQRRNVWGLSVHIFSLLLVVVKDHVPGDGSESEGNDLCDWIKVLGFRQSY